MSWPWSAARCGTCSSAGRPGDLDLTTDARPRSDPRTWSAAGPIRSGRSASVSAPSACARATRSSRSPPTAASSYEPDFAQGPMSHVRPCRWKRTWAGATSPSTRWRPGCPDYEFVDPYRRAGRLAPGARSCARPGRPETVVHAMIRCASCARPGSPPSWASPSAPGGARRR